MFQSETGIKVQGEWTSFLRFIDDIVLFEESDADLRKCWMTSIIKGVIWFDNQ